MRSASAARDLLCSQSSWSYGRGRDNSFRRRRRCGPDAARFLAFVRAASSTGEPPSAVWRLYGSADSTPFSHLSALHHLGGMHVTESVDLTHAVRGSQSATAMGGPDTRWRSAGVCVRPTNHAHHRTTSYSGITLHRTPESGGCNEPGTSDTAHKYTHTYNRTSAPGRSTQRPRQCGGDSPTQVKRSGRPDRCCDTQRQSPAGELSQRRHPRLGGREFEVDLLKALLEAGGLEGLQQG